MTTSPASDVSKARFEQHATRAAFFVPGFVIASWAPLIPYAKDRAALDDATLGALLLCLGGGSLVAMPLAGMLAARHGCRPTMLASVVLMLIALPLLTLISAPLALGLVLLLFGAAVGAMDCVMNLQAVTVERDSGRTMMSGFHAFYSVGSLAGAALVTLVLGSGLTPMWATIIVMAIAAGVTIVFAHAWRADRLAQATPAFALPHGVVAVIGAVCFVMFLAEGSVLDWSAVFLHEVRSIDRQHAGWGFVAFNLAMTIARLLGDRVIERLGASRAVLIGGLLAASGMAVTTLIPVFAAALAGYALVGIGCANIVPVMFTLSGRQRAMPESLAVPAVTTMGYAGILAGPGAIGLVAQARSLTGALLLVSLALAVAAFVGAHLSRRSL